MTNKYLDLAREPKKVWIMQVTVIAIANGEFGMILKSLEERREESEIRLVGWFIGWVLWYINLCRLFNAKSVFMQIVSSISNNSV